MLSQPSSSSLIYISNYPSIVVMSLTNLLLLSPIPHLSPIHQSASSRSISVAATHDVVLCTLRYMQMRMPDRDDPLRVAAFLSDGGMKGTSTEGVGGNSNGNGSNSSSGRRKYELITDDLLVNLVLPSFETAFLGREVHRCILQGRMDHHSSTTTTINTTTGGSSHRSSLLSPELSQGDLLSSLKALSSVRYSDVRHGVIAGLLQLLQGCGQIISSDNTG